jgi:putative FmdB family regulatory protein
VPIYEYKCPNSHLFEVFHGMTEPSPDECEICGEGPLVRVLHPVAVHYKGSGFYSTDYGKGSRKKDSSGADGAGSDGGGSSGSDGGSAQSGDSKTSSDSGSSGASSSTPPPKSSD